MRKEVVDITFLAPLRKLCRKKNRDVETMTNGSWLPTLWLWATFLASAQIHPSWCKCDIASQGYKDNCKFQQE